MLNPWGDKLKNV
jgi:hypothetical protein